MIKDKKWLNLVILINILIFSSESYLQKCPDSYFFDVQHCQKCKQNCICYSQNTCSSCIDGYTFYKNQCIQCPQGYGIYGQCSGCCSRQQGTILACTDCTPVTGMYSFLFSGRCILSQGCFQVDSNGFCTQCRNGYYQANNLCYTCHQSCQTCSDISNCLTCSQGYYWTLTHGGLCTACPQGCKTCDQKGLCYSCLDYFYQYNSHCLQCPQNCNQCLDGSTCTSCSSGILVSNLCIQCTDTAFIGSDGCLKCSQNNNFIKCQECDDSYFLDSSTGICRKCFDFITGAHRCRDQNTPTQCLNDYHETLSMRNYLVGITCIPNYKKCKKMIDVQGNCLTCYQKYTLSLTYQCQLCPFIGCKPQKSTVLSNLCTCQECLQGYYLPSESVVCQLCTSTLNCAICANNVCSACMTGYYLSGDSCLSAIVLNCQILATSTTCNTCIEGYYKGTDNLCYACQNHCQKCANRFNCTQCHQGYYLHALNYCVKMPNNCIQYDQPTQQCLLCSHGYFLSNGFCLQCSVEKGTLNLCQGLCPIDYYIIQLLSIKGNYNRQNNIQFYISISFLIIFLLQ